MNLRPAFAKLARTWICWSSFKLAFFLGCIAGMVVEAILITVPQALMTLTGVLP